MKSKKIIGVLSFFVTRLLFSCSQKPNIRVQHKQKPVFAKGLTCLLPYFSLNKLTKVFSYTLYGIIPNYIMRNSTILFLQFLLY